MRAWYTTVERVMRAADIAATAYVMTEIGEAIESASESVDRLVKIGDSIRPGFAPWKGEIEFDWPVANNDDAYLFWLNNLRLHSVTAVTSAGDDLTSLALPWPSTGPAYSALAIDTSGSDSFDFVDGTGQRSLAIEGVWGIVGDDRSRSGWTLGASVNASAGTLVLNAPIGTGSIVLIGSERMFVTARGWADSGQTASALSASMAAQSITVSDGSAFLAGEDITIESERMIVRDVVGNILTVQRAADGSTLAAHSGATAIYWARSCTMERGALGTTAAAHTSGDAISIYRPPAIAEQLTIAYAIDRQAQENVNYARALDHIRDQGGLSSRKAGGGVQALGMAALEERALAAYGRIRHRAI